jgi:SAM-dependent methyltransferase
MTEGDLCCPRCGKHYPIRDGIPHFIVYEELTGTNRRFARLYDWMSNFYLPVSQIAQVVGARFGISRRDLIQRLDPKGGRFLEVSIGPGVNLPYLCGAPGVDEVFGLDISLGQLRHCQAFCRRRGYNVDVFLGQAEQLPFQNETFDGILHFGGINFFNDKRSAIQEMIRVARPGARIVIGDETERLARVYDRTIPGFSRSFEGKREVVNTPVSLVPQEMQDLQLDTLWHGAVYCLSFRKPS